MLKLLCPCCYDERLKVEGERIKCTSCKITFTQDKAKLKEVQDEKH